MICIVTCKNLSHWPTAFACEGDPPPVPVWTAAATAGGSVSPDPVLAAIGVMDSTPEEEHEDEAADLFDCPPGGSIGC